MRPHASAAALRIGVALLAGWALVVLEGCVEPRAITAASGIEIAAVHPRRGPGSVAARDLIREVRVGHGLDTLGKVPPGFGATRFAVGDPIHLSMWQETDPPAASLVGVSVRDAMDRIVWSEDKEAPRGGSYLSFDIGRELARGKYWADVIIGHEVRSRTGFEVVERKDR